MGLRNKFVNIALLVLAGIIGYNFEPGKDKVNELYWLWMLRPQESRFFEQEAKLPRLYGLDRVHAEGLNLYAQDYRKFCDAIDGGKSIEEILDIEHETISLSLGMEKYLANETIMETLDSLGIKDVHIKGDCCDFYHNGYHVHIWYMLTCNYIYARKCTQEEFLDTVSGNKEGRKKLIDEPDRQAVFSSLSMRQNIQNTLCIVHLTDAEYQNLPKNRWGYLSPSGDTDLIKVMSLLRWDNILLPGVNSAPPLHEISDEQALTMLQHYITLGNQARYAPWRIDDAEQITEEGMQTKTWDLAARIADLGGMELTPYGIRHKARIISDEGPIEVEHSSEKTCRVTIRGTGMDISAEPVYDAHQRSYIPTQSLPIGLYKKLLKSRIVPN